MGTVIQYNEADWLTMKAIKSSLDWYETELRDNDQYGTARRKEKKLLKSCIRDGYPQEAA